MVAHAWHPGRELNDGAGSAAVDRLIGNADAPWGCGAAAQGCAIVAAGLGLAVEGLQQAVPISTDAAKGDADRPLAKEVEARLHPPLPKDVSGRVLCDELDG